MLAFVDMMITDENNSVVESHRIERARLIINILLILTTMTAMYFLFVMLRACTRTPNEYNLHLKFKFVKVKNGNYFNCAIISFWCFQNKTKICCVDQLLLLVLFFFAQTWLTKRVLHKRKKKRSKCFDFTQNRRFFFHFHCNLFFSLQFLLFSHY